MILLIGLMIVVGGLTRLTDSGLSITQWQLFSGIIPPITEEDWIYYFSLYKEIPEFKLQNYSMSINEFKTNIGNNSRLLGIDPGKKNIGIAICDENKAIATPFKVIQKNFAKYSESPCIVVLTISMGLRIGGSTAENNLTETTQDNTEPSIVRSAGV